MNTIISDKASILSIGNELLSGKTVNTNAAYIAQKLATVGLKTVRTLTVGDSQEEIQWGAEAACAAAPLVICTGGLGPTHDDISKKAVADYFGREIQVSEEQLDIVREQFKSFGYKKMPVSNITQAEIPEGAVTLPNQRGTSPGLIINNNGVVFIMLPGVPVEMEGLMTDQVVPYLKKHLSHSVLVVSRTIRTTGIGESKLAEILNSDLAEIVELEVAFLPDPLGVDIRLTSQGREKKALNRSIQEIEKRIVALIPDNIYGYDDDSMESVVGSLLKKHSVSIAVAESCTGGRASDKITNVAGSSNYFDRAVVAYSNEAKIKLLDIDRKNLEIYGAVSEEIALQMAENIRKQSGCDIGTSITGIAGPGGATPEKLVGLVYIGFSDGFGTYVTKLQLRGERTRIKGQSVQTMLNIIRLRLNDTDFYSN